MMEDLAIKISAFYGWEREDSNNLLQKFGVIMFQKTIKKNKIKKLQIVYSLNCTDNFHKIDHLRI